MVSKTEFSAMLNIIIENDWLSTKVSQLTDLLYEDCQNNDERALITQLLSRFKYISAKCFSDHINTLALSIATTPGIDASTTIVAAMAADSAPDSSQYLVQVLKVKLQEFGWQNAVVTNTFSAAFKASKLTGFSRLNIILVDEFVGSGRTVLNRIDEINRQFATTSVKPKISVSVIFSSIVGINILEEKEINFSYIDFVERGISGFETAPEAKIKTDIMLNMESRLAANANNHDLGECSLGYGKVESLIGIEGANTPNNVFPIFWWPNYVDGERRGPLFTRWMGN